MYSLQQFPLKATRGRSDDIYGESSRVDSSHLIFATAGAVAGAGITALIAAKLSQRQWRNLAHSFESAHLSSSDSLSPSPQAFFLRWDPILAELTEQAELLQRLDFKSSIAANAAHCSLRLAHASEKIRVQMARIGNHEAFINDHSTDVQALAESLQHLTHQLSDSADLSHSLSEAAYEASQEELERGGNLAQLASTQHEEFERIIQSLNEKVAGCEAHTGNLHDFVGFLEAFAQDDEMANLLDEVKVHLNALATLINEQEVVVNKNEQMLARVRKIARQCTLLSFNAAIESSRSGTNGLAFSVVATEIRELAEATEVATNEMEALSALLRSGFDSMIQQSREVVGSLASIMLVADEQVDKVRKFVAQSQEMRDFILAGKDQLVTTSQALAAISDQTDNFAARTIRDATLTSQLVSKANAMTEQLGALRQELPQILAKIDASHRLIADIQAADAELLETLNQSKFECRSARRRELDKNSRRAA